MHLQVNGALREFDSPLSVAQLIEAMNLEDKRVALMVNETIVRRADRERHALSEGDRVEIISMVGGG